MSADFDSEALRSRAADALAQRWPDASLSELEPLAGGISGLTFACWLRGAESPGAGGVKDREAGEGLAAPAPARRVVVKAAPPGLAPVRNRDVLRQARVIRALDGVPGIMVPEVLAEQDGSPPLFVMAFVEGQAYEPRWDLAVSPPAPEIVERRALTAAGMLARMHGPSPASLGLGDEPALPLPDELGRWGRLFETVGEDLRGDERRLFEALRARFPAAVAPRVTHGDYRLGNLQFAGERLQAIIDWELWSIGDPRTDLAWLLVFCDPVMERNEGRDSANRAAAAAMPAAQALVDAYSQVRPGLGSAADLRWFVAAGYYKLASTMAALAKRNRRAGDPDPTLERAAQTLAPTIERGLEVLGGQG